jgi:hypothetical protein
MLCSVPHWRAQHQTASGTPIARRLRMVLGGGGVMIWWRHDLVALLLYPWRERGQRTGALGLLKDSSALPMDSGATPLALVLRQIGVHFDLLMIAGCEWVVCTHLLFNVLLRAESA